MSFLTNLRTNKAFEEDFRLNSFSKNNLAEVEVIILELNQELTNLITSSQATERNKSIRAKTRKLTLILNKAFKAYRGLSNAAKKANK